MYFSTVLLLFLISKFTYAANSPPRQQRMRRQQTISTAEQQTQWILFNRPFSDAKALLQRATADFSIRCSYKIQIKIFSILYLLKLRDPDNICKTRTDESSKVYVTASGKSACYQHCYKKNVDYTHFLNINTSLLAQRFFDVDDIIKLETNDSGISKCVLKRNKFYECFCTLNYTIKISKQFDAFVENTLDKHRRGNNRKLENRDYFVAFVFFLKYFPKSAIFYLRWMFKGLLLEFESDPSTAPDSNALMELPSLQCETDIENQALIMNELSFVPGDRELFDELFNHIYSNSSNMATFFKWCDRRTGCCTFVTSFFISCLYIRFWKIQLTKLRED